METITALATPAGNSGVAIIRISGENSLDALKQITRSNTEFEPRKMYLKTVYAQDIEDKCLVVFFKSPFSYTGEDVVEIQSHGGYFLAQKIIEQILKFGVRLADRGEFSKRAFINGKISLDQAEGIIDLINAESTMQAKSASNLLFGKLKDKLSNIQNDLTDILADIEAKLDYPEYDYTEQESNSTRTKLKDIEKELDSLLSSSKQGLVVKNGIKVAIVGAPNVGKSSLLNALTMSDKAIVTSIAGTTRDVVEAEYEYNGIIFRLFDTAGIHESKDVVEQIGIERAKQILNDCDLVLKISSPDNVCDIETQKLSISVFNKSDIDSPIKDDQKNNSFDIFVSAKNNTNIEQLKQLIFSKTVQTDINSNQLFLTNTRHIECVRLAKISIENALKLVEDNQTFDIISSEIKSAWNKLGEITGVVNDEAILDRIFSKFCLGK